MTNTSRRTPALVENGDSSRDVRRLASAVVYSSSNLCDRNLSASQFSLTIRWTLSLSPSLTVAEISTDTSTARLLAVGGLAALVGVEIQRLVVPHHRPPRQEAPRLLLESLRHLPVGREERQHVLMLSRPLAPAGEQVASRFQGGATSVLVCVRGAGSEYHEPRRRLLGHVGRRSGAHVHALEVAPAAPRRFAHPPFELPLDVGRADLLRRRRRRRRGPSSQYPAPEQQAEVHDAGPVAQARMGGADHDVGAILVVAGEAQQLVGPDLAYDGR